MTLRRSWLLGCAAAAVFSAPVVCQQQPIFGCRHAINCRPSPVSSSALNDAAGRGLLVSAGVRWSPGFHFGLASPVLNLPAREPTPTSDVHALHLHNATLLPPVDPDLAPTPTPLPAPATPR